MKSELDINREQKEAEVTKRRDDFSKLKVRHEGQPEQRRKENLKLNTNTTQNEKVLSRAERRELERKEKKKK